MSENCVVHKNKQFKWEGNSLLWVWTNGRVWIILCLEQHEGIIWHAHEELGHFGI
jgi:hypothetical protein